MDDVRWFAPNAFCALPVEPLRAAGLAIATSGDEPARLAFASDGVSATEAYRHAHRHRCPLAVYLWDLPPWQLDGGSPNRVIPCFGRLVKVPSWSGAYPERNGYYSRLRYLSRHAVAVWSPSANTAADVRRRFGAGAVEVPFCIDSDRFNRNAGWTPPRGRPVVLAVSRLVPHKNHAAIVRAVGLLSPRPLLRIIGRGPEASALRLLAATVGVDLELDESWRSDREILDAYLGASVVVSMSRFEGMGLTPLEAIALGIPAIASDIPPHRELAAPHAHLVPLDADATLAQAIDDAVYRPRAIERSARHPLAELSIEACAARLLPRFNALLGRG